MFRVKRYQALAVLLAQEKELGRGHKIVLVVLIGMLRSESECTFWREPRHGFSWLTEPTHDTFWTHSEIWRSGRPWELDILGLTS